MQLSSELPIHTLLADLRDALASHAAVVLEAPPGAGKTTQVPLALLDAPWLAGKRILMLEPRRLAARAAAAYMAQLLGEKTGQTVGYRVRFDSQVSSATRIEVLTEGILTRRLQQDPELDGVGLVIFDEFHERNLHSDLALALCRDAQLGLREDLRLLVMSATLDGERIANLLDAPRLRSEGRSYPVDIRYCPPPANRQPQRLEDEVARLVRQAWQEEAGDVLVFLPGAGEIRRCAQRLADLDGLITPLYGDLPLAAQQAAIEPDPQGRRKLVLASAIAETSLTIEGVRVVVDSGWQRLSRFDPNTGLSRLETVRVSQAAATQRAGRAGRLGPGVCYRLWGDSLQRGLLPFNPPEILEADLAPLALDLAQWGVGDARQLSWLDPPPPAALGQAQTLLQGLDALDTQGRITPMGKAMLRWPLHPRLAHMLVRAGQLAQAETDYAQIDALACELAALLSERDPLRGPGVEGNCDLSLRIEAMQALRRGGPEAARRLGADPRACAGIERVAAQWRKQLGLAALQQPVSEEAIGLLLALAYPDRIARRRQQGEGRYLLANGRGAALARDCTHRPEWLVAATLDGATGAGGEARIYLAAGITRAQLERHLVSRICWQQRIAWDRQSQSVLAVEQCQLGALILAERPLGKLEPEALCTAMLEGIQAMGLTVLPWSEDARQLQARVLSLRHWLGEAWPDLSDAALANGLADWLGPYLQGISRREHLSRLDLRAILLAQLDWSQQQALDRLAPTHLQVPSGSRKRLHYETDGSAPVLAVKLQELFGLRETPRLADGRTPLTLHLLSPAQRPIQVTQDLASFWQNTYAEVKKELKGRYPKHPWPDDPLQAPAQAGVKRRQLKT
ncbi:MAG: ATP-dependent helicase HrpB [Gammaproteobacteria bacterium]|nr:ATP-dependent helicase HrpB [Gammaproteobacteria bacterium]